VILADRRSTRLLSRVITQGLAISVSRVADRDTGPLLLARLMYMRENSAVSARRPHQAIDLGGGGGVGDAVPTRFPSDRQSEDWNVNHHAAWSLIGRATKPINDIPRGCRIKLITDGDVWAIDAVLLRLSARGTGIDALFRIRRGPLKRWSRGGLRDQMASAGRCNAVCAAERRRRHIVREKQIDVTAILTQDDLVLEHNAFFAPPAS